MNLGKAAIYPAGEYVDGEEYLALDMVTYGSGVYIAKEDNQNVLPTDSSIWMKMGEFATISIMTASRNGIGRPDNDTIKVNANGVFYSTCKPEKVNVIPTAANAEKNTLYLLENSQTTGVNKYQMWTLMGDEMVCISDRSPNLSNYVLLTDFEAHRDSSVVSADGVHGIRYYEGKFQGYDSDKAEWFDIATGGGGGVDIGDVSGAAVVADRSQAKLTWTDPEDVVLSGVTLAKWGGTLIRRKEGSAPTDKNDGVKVLDSKTKNAYSSTPYVDTGLEYGKTYYYRFFPYTTGGNYTDGSSVSVTPTRTVITTVPSQSGTFTYDGTEQEPVFADYDSTKLTIGGVTTGTNADTYTATFTPKTDYEWSDGTQDAKNVTWTINKASLTIPSQNGVIVYDGTEINPAENDIWLNYDSAKMSVTGTAQTDAGSYNAVFSLLDEGNYEWSDSTITDKTVTWTITRADSVMTVSDDTVTLDTSTMYKDVTIELTTGDGTLSVVLSDDSIAKVEHRSDNTYRITAVANGTATITASVPQTTNYKAKSVEISVAVSLVSNTLNDNDWDTISAISATGNASSYWDVGDCKEITLNGTVGMLSLSNQKECVYILGFDHNSSVEGSGISFGCFKTALTGGVDVGLCDSMYNTNHSDGTKAFNMNHWGGSSSPYNTNYGGWAACDMRYDILGSTNQAPTPYGSTKTTSATGQNPTSTCATSPVANTLMAALPSALRAVMKPITKYTDNTGNSSNVQANVTSTVDYLPLLSEFEVQGARTYANEYEKNSQKQYKYFENGNSKVKYNHSSTSSAVFWWVRSPYYGNANYFCFVDPSGGAYYDYSRYSNAVAPAFLV